MPSVPITTDSSPVPLLWDPGFSRSHPGITDTEPLRSAAWPKLKVFLDDLANSFFFEHLTFQSQAILRNFERETSIRTRSIYDERY